MIKYMCLFIICNGFSTSYVHIFRNKHVKNEKILFSNSYKLIKNIQNNDTHILW